MKRERRCLIVAPVFPPSGLPPAHRARLFVRHLPSFGWEPVVLTVDPRDREEVPEHALTATVPSHVQIEYARALPALLARVAGIGDVAIRALPWLALRAVSVARRADASAVLLVVPPWYGLLLAPWLERRLGIPVVVDYLDPWDVGGDVGGASGFKRALAAWVAARAEGPCLRQVAGVFAVSDGIVQQLRVRFPFLDGRPAGAAPYGFEPTDLALLARHTAAGASPPSAASNDHAWPLRIVYVGAISQSQRVVMCALLDAITRLRRRSPEVAARIRVDCYGTGYARPGQATTRVADLAAERGLKAWVTESPGRVPYAEALAMMATSGANLVLGDLTTYYAASKLMPVLASGRPVLAVLHSETEPARLLRRLNASGLVCYGNAAAPTPGDAVFSIADKLECLAMGRVAPIAADAEVHEVLKMRTAEHMTRALARVLDNVVAAA